LWISGFKQKSYYKSQAAKPGTEIEIFVFLSSSGSTLWESEKITGYIGREVAAHNFPKFPKM
jgi:hypothetical protein